MFTIATGYLGDNLIAIFFMMCGFAEGHLVGGGDRAFAKAPVVSTEVVVKERGFQRVIA